MPLKPGKSQKVVSKNIKEIHSGPQYQKTKREHGAAVANKQAIAIAESKKRESMSGNRKINTGGNVVVLRRLGIE